MEDFKAQGLVPGVHTERWKDISQCVLAHTDTHMHAHTDTHTLTHTDTHTHFTFMSSCSLGSLLELGSTMVRTSFSSGADSRQQGVTTHVCVCVSVCLSVCVSLE